MTVYNNYAEALAAGASENDFKLYIDDLKDFLKTFESTETQNFLKSPVLSSDKKIELLKTPLANLNPKVLKLIFALIKRGHSLKLDEAIRQVIDALEKKSGFENAILKTPVELEASEVDSIKTTLSKILNKKIKIEVVVDRSLIAGFKVQVGGMFFDNSISNHLKKLKDRFKVSEGRYEN